MSMINILTKRYAWRILVVITREGFQNDNIKPTPVKRVTGYLNPGLLLSSSQRKGSLGISDRTTHT